MDLLDAHKELAEYEVARFTSVATRRERSRIWSKRRSAQRQKGHADSTQQLRPAGRTPANPAKDPNALCGRRPIGRCARCGSTMWRCQIPVFRKPRKPSQSSAGRMESERLGVWVCLATCGRCPSVSKGNSSANQRRTLADLGVPKLETRKDVLQWLQISSLRETCKNCCEPAADRAVRMSRSDSQSQVVKPGRSGAAHDPAQNSASILDELLSKLPTHNAAHGFVKKRSVVTNAKPHEGAQLVVKLDIKDFFPTISFYRVRGLLCGYGFRRKWPMCWLDLRRIGRCSATDMWCGWRASAGRTDFTCPGQPDLSTARFAAHGAREENGRSLHALRRRPDVFVRHGPDQKTTWGVLWWINQICQQEGFAENVAKRKILVRRPNSA